MPKKRLIIKWAGSKYTYKGTSLNLGGKGVGLTNFPREGGVSLTITNSFCNSFLKCQMIQ